MNRKEDDVIVEQVIDCPYDDDAQDRIKELLLYRKIVRVANNVLETDNGVFLEIVPNEGAPCGCGDYEITELNGCDNAITDVELVFEEVEESYKIFVYAEDKRIKILQVDGTDGTGFYGTGYSVIVKRLKVPGQVYLQYDWSHLMELGYTKEELAEIDRKAAKHSYVQFLVMPEYVDNVRENTRYMLQYFDKPTVLRLLIKYEASFREEYKKFAVLMKVINDALGDDWIRIVQTELEEAQSKEESQPLMSILACTASRILSMSGIRGIILRYRKPIKEIEINKPEYSLTFAIHKKGFVELTGAKVNSALFSLPGEITDGDGTVYPVKEIGSLAFAMQKMKYLILPEGIEWIDLSAFHECGALMTVVFPSSLRMMNAPFFGCWQYTDNQGGEIQFRGSREQWEAVCNFSLSDSTFSKDRTPYRKIVRFVGDKQNNLIPDLDIQKYYAPQYSDEADSVRVRLCNLQGVVEVPETYTDENGERCTITEIGPNAFAYNKELTTVIIPSSVCRIHCTAFYKCENLENVVISQGEDMLQMDEYVFAECKKLKSVQCGRPMQAHSTTMEVLQGSDVAWCYTTLTTKREAFIAEVAYRSCWSIGRNFSEGKRVVVDEDGFVHLSDMRGANYIKTTVNILDVELKEDGCAGPVGVYALCKDGTGLHFGEDEIIYIIDDDYSGWGTAYEHFEQFPDGDSRAESERAYEAMWQWASEHGTELLEDELEDEDVESGGFKIVDGQLVGYYGSESCVTIPEGITDIGDEAFQNREHLTSVVIPEGVEYIGLHAFSYCENLTTVEMPDSVEEISNCAFEACRKLTRITIPEGTHIGDGAFGKCNGLADEDGWIIFNETCFDNVSGAAKLRIPDNVEVISGGALSDLHNLKTVFIPNHVTQVRRWSISRCENLESVVFLNDSVEIERGVFSNCDYEKLVVYARPGSTAEQYALSNGIKCAPLFANMKESD